MALVGVDQVTFYLLVIVVPIVGAVMGFLARTLTYPRVVRATAAAIKKKVPLLLETADDLIGWLRPVRRGEAALWHLPLKEYTPEPNSTMRFYGTTLGVAHMGLAATLNPQFVEYGTRIFEQNKGKDPVQVSKMIWGLVTKVSLYQNQVDFLEDIQKRMEDGRASWKEEAQKAGFREEDLIKMVGQLPKLRAELFMLAAASKITVKEENPDLVFDFKNGKIWYRKVLDLTHIPALVPAGASAHAMWLYGEGMKRGADAEKGNEIQRKFFWMLGIMMAMIGAGVMLYLIFSGLRIGG